MGAPTRTRASGAPTTTPATERRPRRTGLRPRIRTSARPQWPGYLLVLPCVVLLLAMMLYPLLQTLVFSVSNVQLPTFVTSFTGLSNFTRIFSDRDLPGILGRTVLWVVGTVVLRFVLGFWAAVTLNEKVRGRLLMRILCILPWTIPSIVSANLWRWMLQADTGIVNQALRSVGLAGLAHDWLGDPKTAELAVMVAYSWAGFPFVMLMLLAGMQAIPGDIYEAAKVDGAGWLQSFRFITVPSLRNITVIVLLLEIISGLNSFDLLWVMTAGGPGNSSETLSLFIYQTGLTNFDMGGASALSVVMLVGALVFFLFYGGLYRAANRQGSTL